MGLFILCVFEYMVAMLCGVILGDILTDVNISKSKLLGVWLFGSVIITLSFFLFKVALL